MSYLLRKAAEELLEELSKLDLSAICDVPTMKAIGKASDNLEQALAQPEGEPVAWACVINGNETVFFMEPPEDAYDGNSVRPLYTHPSNTRRPSDDKIQAIIDRNLHAFGCYNMPKLISELLDACNLPKEGKS